LATDVQVELFLALDWQMETRDKLVSSAHHPLDWWRLVGRFLASRCARWRAVTRRMTAATRVPRTATDAATRRKTFGNATRSHTYIQVGDFVRVWLGDGVASDPLVLNPKLAQRRWSPL
jgi:hypothetical protein